MQLTEGTKYKVCFRHPNTDKTRWYVMTYLGKNTYGEYQFDVRPVGGTLTLTRSNIVWAREVLPNRPHSV